ncbi:GLE1-like protein-domain-containing protein [Lentinula edodes]|uniref:mRNA export factor GLE1 n=1 Tax=Lentinula lateritia TaxID=40482 RepID=A0A9W9AB00_9AGAR|nr:GLE1-like protein-domain-containing protein [Lentinula edodes]
MRFTAPRSPSSSPERKPNPGRRRTSPSQRRRASTFGLNSSSESDVDEVVDLESDSGESVPGSSDSDSFCYGSESEIPPLPSKQRKFSSRPSREQNQIDDTIAAIRLRTRHHDPYEEWEKDMKKDSLRAARKNYNDSEAQFIRYQNQRRIEDSKRLAAAFKQDELQLIQKLDGLRLQQQAREKTLQEKLAERNEILWKRIEASIKLEQDKEQVKLDEQRRVREEAEKRRREEEENTRREEQRKRDEEERKRREEEGEKRKKEEEERRLREEKEAAIQEAKEREERLKSEEENRKAAGMTTSEEDWKEARKNLQVVKTQGTRLVKATPTLKPTWSSARRAITAKIGQLTNDAETINRVSSQLVEILLPVNRPLPPPVYTALLSALAKALVLQAETEITAEKRSAIPLAEVTFNCLERLEGFSEVLFAKITQRIGPWALPCPIPEKDFDDRPWKDNQEVRRIQGFRSGEDGVIETQSQYTDRVKGVMRLYFSVLKITPKKAPLKKMFQLPRYWTWMARLLGSKTLLATAVGAEVLFVALEVLGADALLIWGYQFVKMLRVIYDASTEGLGGGKVLGGTTPDGIAARARVKLEVESIMKGGQ